MIANGNKIILIDKVINVILMIKPDFLQLFISFTFHAMLSVSHKDLSEKTGNLICKEEK
jgi:hypothetical protein